MTAEQLRNRCHRIMAKLDIPDANAAANAADELADLLIQLTAPPLQDRRDSYDRDGNRCRLKDDAPPTWGAYVAPPRAQTPQEMKKTLVMKYVRAGTCKEIDVATRGNYFSNSVPVYVNQDGKVDAEPQGVMVGYARREDME